MSTGSVLGLPWLASKRDNHRRSSSILRIRLDSSLTRSKALRYQVLSRSCARARLVCASMTDRGVRSSCEASAEKSSWRRRATSMGVATRRPMATAPRNTAISRMGPISSSASTMVDWVASTGAMFWPTTT